MRKLLGQCACSSYGETGNKPRLLCKNSYSDMAEYARSKEAGTANVSLPLKFTGL